MPFSRTVARLTIQKSFPLALGIRLAPAHRRVLQPKFLRRHRCLGAELPAVDGKAVQPIKGNFFQLGVAQRLDLKVTIPKEGGAYPILAQGEGTKLLCGIVLVTKGASVPQLSRTAAASTAALDNTQEKSFGLSIRFPIVPIDRTLPATLGGNMATYVWTINDAAYPNRKSLDIQERRTRRNRLHHLNQHGTPDAFTWA